MASGFPDYSVRIFANAENNEQGKVSATATAGSQTWTQQIKYAIVYNSGTYQVHVAADETATTSKFPIPSGAYVMIPVSHEYLSFICATGETATVYCWGFY